MKPLKLNRWMLCFVLSVLYFWLGKLGLHFAQLNPSASLVWPPTGLALASLLVLGTDVWPGIFIGAFFVNLTTNGTVLTSLAIAGGNTLEGLLGAWLINRFAHGRRVFDRPSDVFKYALWAGFVAPLVSSLIGVTTLIAGGLASSNQFKEIWLAWWMGDMSGALIIAPLLITLADDRHLEYTPAKIFEFIVMCCSILFIGGVVFTDFFFPATMHQPMTHLCLTVLIWAALRFSQREAAFATFLVSIVGIWGTWNGAGPFAPGLPGSLFFLQFFMVMASITSLSVAAMRNQWYQAQKDLESKDQEERTRLIESQMLLAEIVESSEDAIVGLTLEGVVSSWNRSAERLFGWMKNEALGEHVAFIFPSDGEAEFRETVSKIKKNELVPPYESVRINKDGTPIHVSIVTSPIKNAAGELIGVAKISRDITARKQLEKAVLDAADEERHRIGRDLHDGLGQQLLGIGFLANVLNKNLVSKEMDKESKDAALIEEQINQALFQTRTMARQMYLAELEKNDLVTALKQLTTQVEQASPISCSFECEMPVTIEDPSIRSALYRISQEALSNAVKHSQGKKVTVSLSKKKETIVLMVQDDGVGIQNGKKQSDGSGLRNMTFRANTIGASLEVRTRPQGGTLVKCTKILNNIN